jgi:hypothetical protein
MAIYCPLYLDICKAPATRISSKFFFSLFFTSFDRTWAADHEKLLFSGSKCFFPFEKYEKLEECRIFQKTNRFRMRKIFCFVLFISFWKYFFCVSNEAKHLISFNSSCYQAEKDDSRFFLYHLNTDKTNFF